MAELTNDQILDKINKHQEAIKDLKSQLKPTPPKKEVPLHVLNAYARSITDAPKEVAEPKEIKSKNESKKTKPSKTE